MHVYMLDVSWRILRRIKRQEPKGISYQYRRSRRDIFSYIWSIKKVKDTDKMSMHQIWILGSSDATCCTCPFQHFSGIKQKHKAQPSLDTALGEMRFCDQEMT